MQADLLDPEVRKAVTGVPRLPFGIWGLNWLAKGLYDYAASSKPHTDRVDVEDLLVKGRKHRVIRPKGAQTSRGTALWFYGGGHLAGKPEHLDLLGSLLASQVGLTFVAPEYRLAPKNPYPADIEDAFQSWNWLLANSAELGLDRNRIIVGGNSAGGGIAAALSQKVADQNGIQPLAQVLFYPMLDDRVAADTTLDAEAHFIWSNAQNRRAWSAYLSPNKPGEARLPTYASPARRKDLAGLPPAWMGICELDLFRGECQDYADRLIHAAVDCQVFHAKGVPHAFESICPSARISKAFVNAALEYCSAKIG